MVGYVIVVIVFGIFVNLRLILEIDLFVDGENIVIWGNFFMLVMFVVFVFLVVVF